MPKVSFSKTLLLTIFLFSSLFLSPQLIFAQGQSANGDSCRYSGECQSGNCQNGVCEAARNGGSDTGATETTLDIAAEAKKQNLPGAKNTNPDASLGNFLSFALSLAMAVGALLVFAFLIMGAFEWITSGGDKGKLDAARNRIVNAVIGLLILSASVALFTLLQKILGITFIRFI